ncbi:hypothetical protein J6S88_03095 [bacterium]|nr:hypothetical protein [bacterium]
MIKILILEILATAIILTPIIWLNIKVRELTKCVDSQNKGLRELISLARSILKLSGEYIDIMHKTFREKMYSFVVLIGEITSYSLMRRMFAKYYQNFVIGFNIAKLFW